MQRAQDQSEAQAQSRGHINMADMLAEPHGKPPPRPSSNLREAGVDTPPEVGFDGKEFFAVPTHDIDGLPYTKRQLASLKMWELRRRKAGIDAPKDAHTTRALRKDGKARMRNLIGPAQRPAPPQHAQVCTAGGKSLSYRLAGPKAQAKPKVPRPPRPALPSARPCLSRQDDGLLVLPPGVKTHQKQRRPKPPKPPKPPALYEPKTATATYKEIKRQLSRYQSMLADKSLRDQASAADTPLPPPELRRLLPRHQASRLRRQAICEELTEHHTIAQAERCQPPPRRPQPLSSRRGLTVLPKDLRARLSAIEEGLRQGVPPELRALADQLTAQVKGGLQASMADDEALHLSDSAGA